MSYFYIYIAGIILCIACSAFFSASEMAYSACSRVRLEHQRDNGDKKAAIAVKIREGFDDALSAILVGNNLVNIAASSMGSLAVMAVLSEEYTWISTLVIDSQDHGQKERHPFCQVFCQTRAGADDHFEAGDHDRGRPCESDHRPSAGSEG